MPPPGRARRRGAGTSACSACASGWRWRAARSRLHPEREAARRSRRRSPCTSRGSAMASIRVVLADDHALMRAGLRAILSGLPDIEVVGEAADGRMATELCARHKPDIVLLDVSMASLNGIGAAEQIVKAGTGTRVIILSMFGSEEYVLQALRAGASGYILKGASTSELELAIRTVAGGETFLGPSISSTVINGYLDMATRGKHSSEILTS